jgi:exosortase E/protease (VPEID-CTERM system)
LPLPYLSVEATGGSFGSAGKPVAVPFARDFVRRVLLLVALFVVELIGLTVWLDNDRLANATGLTRFVALWGPWILRGAVGFAGIFATFVYLANRSAIEQISSLLHKTPIRGRILLAHFIAIAAFAGVSALLYSNHSSPLADLTAVAWLSTGLLSIALGGIALIPLPLWIKLIRDSGFLWIYALVAICLACVAGNLSRTEWQPTSKFTFFLTQAMLTPFVSKVVSIPSTMILGTPRFEVEIAPQCSGYEGVGLMLIFGILWLWFFRKECRFPHALSLIPAGMILIYLLNAARLAALIMIGDAGFDRVALGGFHSQAGWIAFNCVAVGFCIAARHVRWISKERAPEKTADLSSANPAAAYLFPFIAILAAGMVSRAGTADFEWLYPLRFVAAIATIWIFRRSYAALDWRCGFAAPTIGIVVLLIWIGADRFAGVKTEATPAALASASYLARIGWILARTLAAIITVPIAEELAFRGFLIRRLMSADFDSLPPRQYTMFAVAVSSLAFGLLHGQQWLAGIVAGLFYAWAYLRKGRIGHAVVAHATTNALLAVYVLRFQQWHLW